MNHGQVDSECVSSFRAGDRRAMEAIYRCLYERIFHFANGIVRSQEEANDITADTFIKLWRLHERFENFASIKGFLYTTCRNACIDILRLRQRNEACRRELLYLSREGELGSDREDMERLLMKEIRLQVERLPPRCREVFKLIFFKRMRSREVAAELGISVATVEGQRSIAIRKLRDALMRKGLFDYFYI